MVRVRGSRGWAAMVVTGLCVAASGGSVAAGGGTQRQQGSGGQVRMQPAAQVTRNDRADVTFELRPAATGGGITVVARSGDLQVTKTVQPTGDFAIEIASGPDKVTVSASGQGATVTRGRASFSLRRNDASDDGAAKIRRVMADSEAIVKYRTIVARLIEDDDRSDVALALILGDATVGLLAGDVGAPRRVARFLVEHRLKNARKAGMVLDCFALMEERMVEAWYDYGSCYYSTAYNSFYQYLCSWRWTIQVESYWFNFISCSGFNIS